MNKISDLILRPTREKYDPYKDLGPKLFFVENMVFKRKDLTLFNSRGLAIECSHFIPLNFSKVNCVVYCHGNCGSRLDSFDIVENLLPKEVSVFVFDFAGQAFSCLRSGISQGDYVTLGYYEQNDIQVVIDYLLMQKEIIGIAI